MEQVLQDKALGNFQVIKLVNPHPQALRTEIERFLGSDRFPDDVLLFYFTGHGALDNATGMQLYLSTYKELRLLRGGSWYHDPKVCRSANRFRDRADLRYNFVGFRAACSAPSTLYK
ncbi:MAG: hypothetical protein F6K16_30370 [Symploca sp. SIO2B6]|nr:hypothetical protein [Symploca sp. SIO2B6]